MAAPADAQTSTLDSLCINTVRTLAMDAVQKAESGHPGAPMGLAPLAYALFTRHMRHDPADPNWPNRDRFVLSNGHASMLLYSSLFLSGYDLTLDDIKPLPAVGEPARPATRSTDIRPASRRPPARSARASATPSAWRSAEAHLAATFNKPGHAIVDHHTYFICGDGCLMEGISHEAASFAGHFKLGKLIGFYDSTTGSRSTARPTSPSPTTRRSASRPTAGRCSTSTT